MRFIVTGATGFIGRWLIKGIKESGHECTAIVRSGQKEKCKADLLFAGVDIIELEMADYYKIGRILPDMDFLVNLAWDGSRGIDRMDADLQRKNYIFTMSAIQSMKNTDCKCIITAGSQAEYGNVRGKITERTNPVPNTEYGKYKLKLFEDASDFCESSHIKLIEPRYFSIYGPGDDERTMIVTILKKMLRNQDCDLTKSIQMWDFLYIEDAVEALIMLLSSNSNGGIYNFASGDCRHLTDFVEEMYSISRSSSKLNYGAITYPNTGMVSMEPDISKLVEATGWTAKTKFIDGITAVMKSL